MVCWEAHTVSASVECLLSKAAFEKDFSLNSTRLWHLFLVVYWSRVATFNTVAQFGFWVMKTFNVEQDKCFIYSSNGF